MEKKNGVHLRWGAIATILALIGFLIGTFVNPTLGKIGSNTDAIHIASVARETMRGDISVVQNEQKNLQKQLDRMEETLDEILKELRGQ